MNPEDDTTNVDDPEADASFGAGFDNKPDKPEKPKPAEIPQAATELVPEYVQITKADWDAIRTAATKTASYDKQFATLHGTTGNLQKVLNAIQSQTPRGTKVDLKEAFAEMEKDFPELAQQSRAAFEKAFSGLSGTGAPAEVDEGKITDQITQRTRALQIEDLKDAHPDWMNIVGAVDMKTQQPDPGNPFRKWLGTKSDDYQARVNGTESAGVILRAINLFQRETKPQPKQTPRADQRREQIAAAVQPKGDGGKPSARDSLDDAFASGFNSS